MQRTASEIFDTFSRELRRLAERTAALQDQLSSRGYDDSEIGALQSLDCVNQALDCLAAYSARLGAAARCACAVPIDEAAGHVSLSALADRLRDANSAAAEPAASGVELF